MPGLESLPRISRGVPTTRLVPRTDSTWRGFSRMVGFCFFFTNFVLASLPGEVHYGWLSFISLLVKMMLNYV